MKMELTLVFLFMAVMPTMATEQWYRVFGPNGNAFIVECKAAVHKVDDPDWQGTKQEAHDSGFCSGLVTGVAETMNENEGVDLSDAAITSQQLVRVVQKYMEDHPELLSKPASWLIRTALIKAFPVHK
jgi:hypothetical protein